MAELKGTIGGAAELGGSLAPVGGYSASMRGAIGPISDSIRDGAVTTPKLADLAVTTAKIADAAVTLAKLASEVIDATLSVTGAAADAKATGDALALKAAAADLTALANSLGDAAYYDVANNLTTAAAGSAVLDAYQGKVLNDAVNAKIQYFYTKYFTTGKNNTKLSIHNSEDQQRYFLFGSGSASTTLCAIIYIRTSGIAYCQTMGTKSVSIEKSGENGVLTVGQWGAGTLICDSPFTFTYE